MNNMTETTAFGEAFLRDWYRKIDGKAPFSELARLRGACGRFSEQPAGYGRV